MREVAVGVVGIGEAHIRTTLCGCFTSEARSLPSSPCILPVPFALHVLRPPGLWVDMSWRSPEYTPV